MINIGCGTCMNIHVSVSYGFVVLDIVDHANVTFLVAICNYMIIIGMTPWFTPLQQYECHMEEKFDNNVY